MRLKILCLLLIAAGCSSSTEAERRGTMRFYAYDSAITDPSLDRRSYYKIYIDKEDAGRTTIGLESQKKIFETRLSFNRHVISVEKWVLNEKTGEYEKLNNINQPKPSFVYFEIAKKGPAVITMAVDGGNRAFFNISDD